MDTVQAALRRIRHWFLVWFIAEAAVGTATAAYVLDGLRHHSPLRHALPGAGTAGTIFGGVVVSLLLLLLAWVVLEALLELRPWARVVMLVVGWITIVSAAINLVSLPASSALLAPVARLTGSDWAALSVISAVTKAADLAFWPWVIYLLQINPAVRAAFLGHGAVPAGTAST